MRVLVDAEGVQHGLRRVAGAILEQHRSTEGLLVVGIRRGGVPVAAELRRWLGQLHGEVASGTLDITLYRDDAATALPNPRIGPSELPASVDGLCVILVDDVLYTGRTVRAAIDAVMDYGRPRRIELMVVVDRGQRELPIQPDYVVKSVELERHERVDVIGTGEGIQAVVQPANAPSTPPPGGA